MCLHVVDVRMASDDVRQLADSLAKTQVTEGELSYKGRGLKLDNAQSGEHRYTHVHTYTLKHIHVYTSRHIYIHTHMLVYVIRGTFIDMMVLIQSCSNVLTPPPPQISLILTDKHSLAYFIKIIC